MGRDQVEAVGAGRRVDDPDDVVALPETGVEAVAVAQGEVAAVGAERIVVSGGGEPFTPEMRTRSGPSCASWMVEKWVVTSGLRYCSPWIS